MLKKTITYTDYNNAERTETFYFHFSEAEIAEMELGTTGGMQAFIEKIVETKDNKRLVELFKDLILQAYGEKSDDGRRFIKSSEMSTMFSQTGAYVKLFMELAGDAEAAAAFLNGIMPAGLVEAAANELNAPASIKKFASDTPKPPRPDRT